MLSPVIGKRTLERTAAGSLNILLRNAADLVVLNRPPWWTLKRTVALVGTLLTVLFVTLLWAYLLRRRLERQQAARLLFSRQILEGQESERQRIAVNLHDSLGQNLLVIKNQARLAMQSKADEADRQHRLQNISEITSQAIEEVRQITRDLRPYQLDRLGLTQAIRATVCQTSGNSPIQIAVYLDTIDGIFDKESEIHVYRIVQEALNNIVKHSAATEAAVVVKNLPGLISMSIRDNGRGFDAHVAGSSSARDIGYGLTGMKERTRILGGRFMVESHPAQGTIISIEILKPISEA
jgi:signal transduction histidine kinase